VRVVLLGPPGAGKGTQSSRLATELKAVHLSSGDILRAERKSQTELGKLAQGYMDAGSLVPDDLILRMMIGRISSPEASGGFVLDGFPRTIPQAKGLDERLSALRQPIERVVSIEADDALVSRRLTGRWTCPKDGSVFHESHSPPKRAGACDACGTALVRRKDDEPQVVSQRLTTYHAETQPLIEYYRGRGVLKSVDGNAEIEEVYARIVAACRGNG